MLWITHQATMFNIFKHNETTKEALKHSKYFVYIACMFVAVLVISNTTAVKMVQLGFFTVSGATIIFPLSYIFGDVLTEVYGYHYGRRSERTWIHVNGEIYSYIRRSGYTIGIVIRIYRIYH